MSYHPRHRDLQELTKSQGINVSHLCKWCAECGSACDYNEDECPQCGAQDWRYNIRIEDDYAELV